MQLTLQSIRWVMLALLLGLINSSPAQNLPVSRTNSHLTYIYRLEDREALDFLRKGLQDDADRFLHTPVDSFPTDSAYTRKLAPGYYLQTHAERNRQRFAITAVHDFEVMVVENKQDLMLRVYDLQGQVVSDARVKVGGRNLRFDTDRQAYVQRKSNRHGRVSVTRQGRTAYFDLDRQKFNPAIARASRQVLYETPLVYAWIPIHFTIRLPYDAYQSFRYRRPRGTVNQMTRFFERSFERIGCLFDDYYCDNHYRRFTHRHNGYFVFNKPKYQPGDTVMFKAFIVNKHGRPVRGDVDVILSKPRGTVNLGRLSPYNPGGYDFSFVLHDSLELLLDRNYRLSLEVKEGKAYMRGFFRYEDYDLSLIQLNLRTPAETHYRDKPFPVFVKATDENDLHIPDGRLEVSLRTLSVDDYFAQEVFVPDTLWKYSLLLEFNRETDFMIPDSVFPAANLRYELVVRLLTSSNETFTEKRQINYYHSHHEISHQAHADSIVFTHLENGNARNTHLKVSGRDNFGNLTWVAEGPSPVMAAIEPYFASYEIESEQVSRSIPISSISPLLQFYAERNSRQLVFRANNPRNLPFSYQIYRRNRLKKEGYQHEAEIYHQTRSRKNYFVSVQYLWGGKIVEQTYRVPLRENMLNIAVEQPSIIYPGQETEIGLHVSDVDGNPVQGVDITAYGLTGKFKYNPPNVPVMEKQRRNQMMVNRLSISEQQSGRVRFSDLDIQFWATARGLDSIAYYNFIYPQGLYRFEHEARDNITQFAPFVMKEGKPIPIHVLYVDGRPVYFSWTTHDKPWSFRVTPGHRQIRIRTSEHDIVLNNLLFNEGQKLIFSLDADHLDPSWEISEAEPRLSNRESTSLRNFVFPYRQHPEIQFSFLENRDEVIWLNPAGGRRPGLNMAGPVSGKVVYSNLPGDYQLEFDHEPFFAYEFAPKILKMRSVERGAVFPANLIDRETRSSLTDEVITRRMLEQMHYQWKLNEQRTRLFRLNYQRRQSQGIVLRLGLELLTDTLKPEYFLLVPMERKWDFRLFEGSTTNINQLRQGTYRIIFLLENDRYFVVDDFQVKPRGLNYLKINVPDTLLAHQPIHLYAQLVNEVLPKPVVEEKPEEELHMQEKSPEDESHVKAQPYTGPGTTIRGQVLDKQDGQSLPGVMVWVKETEIGTVTDMDGLFEIKIPTGKNWIMVSFIGYRPLELDIRIDDVAFIVMEADISMLQEVVVVAYGVERRSSLTGSVTTISADAIQGIAAGVMISGSPGADIRIRGVAGLSASDAPLYIINGVPFMGSFNDLSPDLIASISVLSGADAIGLYGSRASGGAVVITTHDGFQDTPMGQMLAQSFEVPEFAGHSNRLRENFRDYAFWQPQILTDKEGRARFAVTFPDDITSWETFYLAMNGRKQSGQTRNVIRSYLPLSAQLALPRFLIQSDTVHAIGKVFNYTHDSTYVQTRFSIDGQEIFLRSHPVLHSIIDTLTIVAHTPDSLEIGYTLERADGYFDGEQRQLGVYLPGMPQVSGTFHVLDSDTLINLAFDPAKGSVHLYARADLLEVLEEEAMHVLNYRYLCNEQIASKLKSLLALKKISELRGSSFTQEREINRLVRMLVRNQRSRGKWGWWQGSELSPWISTYVLEALWAAEQQGYSTGMDFSIIAADWTWELDNNHSLRQRMEILSFLKSMDVIIPYELYINEVEAAEPYSLGQWLHFTELRQLHGLPYSLDTLKHFRQETLFGNVFFTEEKKYFSLHENEIQHTLQVYRILKREETDNEEILRKMRNYFLERRGQGRWRNTFESARIIELLIAESFPEGIDEAMPVLMFSGDLETEVREFPYQTELAGATYLGVAMQGAFPVYFTAYQRWQNHEPERTENDFSIRSMFNNSRTNTTLSAGEQVKLTASVRVDKDAEYVMIVIPIPAGCSYTDNRQRLRWEVHREYYRNEVVIFCERLPKGNHFFEVELLARYAGNYTLNPARIELMYFPTFNAHEGMKRIVVE